MDPYRWLALARLAWVVFLVYWFVTALMFLPSLGGPS